MIIQIDSREKPRAITRIVAEFDRQGIKHPTNKLIVGDYMNFDNPRVVVDRKQNLNEVVNNLTQDHQRFRDEVMRAREYDITLIFLVEDGYRIRSVDDVESWVNPRTWGYCRKYGIDTRGDLQANIREFVQHGGQKPPNSGAWLAKTMRTMLEKYGVRWEFCAKSQTGKRIIELLGGGAGA